MKMGKYGTIILDLYKGGIRAHCPELSDDPDDPDVLELGQYDEFIPRGDGNALMDFINDVDGLLHPDATFTLTEKGKKSVRKNKERHGDDD